MNRTYSYKDLENELTSELERLSYHRGYTDIEGFTVVMDITATAFEKYTEAFRTNYFYILFVTKGEFDISIDLNDYYCRENDVLLCTPGSLRRVLNIKSGTIVSGISFTVEFISKVLFQKEGHLTSYFSSAFKPLWNLKEEDSNVIRKALEEIEKRASLPADESFKKQLLLHTFLIFLYEMARIGKKYKVTTSGNISRKETLVNDFLIMVRDRYTTERSVSYYAQRLNISPKYLTEVLKEITGQNAGRIIDEYVLTSIKDLLNHPGYSLSEIAYKLNFTELSSFGKFFKRLTGLSPTEYRRKLYF